MEEKNEFVLMNGEGALTVEGMERIYKALTGKGFTPEERIEAQQELDEDAREDARVAKL